MRKIKAGIVGGAGYTGGELLRLLLNHPEVSIEFIYSRSNAGNKVYTVHADLLGETELTFSGDVNFSNTEAQVIFLCLGHGEARTFLQDNIFPPNLKIIDLSQDFRIKENASIYNRKFVYGLPELHKNEVRQAQHVANPGCFATAIQLGLLPLAQAGLLKEVHTTGITGSTGAGQSLNTTSHFSWRANNIQAYKSLAHQHIKEILQSLSQLSGENLSAESISFVPWRGDFTRGIFVSSVFTCDWSLQKLEELYSTYYADHPFTIISRKEIFLKQAVNTNKCFIQIEKVGTKVVVHSVMDNLLKGASGQAVQNMNLMFQLNECMGLNLKASAF